MMSPSTLAAPYTGGADALARLYDLMTPKQIPAELGKAQRPHCRVARAHGGTPPNRRRLSRRIYLQSPLDRRGALPPSVSDDTHILRKSGLCDRRISRRGDRCSYLVGRFAACQEAVLASTNYHP